MKRVRFAAPVIALGLALSGCEAAPVTVEAPHLAPITGEADQDLYAALKTRSNLLTALAISTLHQSPDTHDLGLLDTESGEKLCVDNVPGVPIDDDRLLRARLCIGGNGLLEVYMSKYTDTNLRNNISLVFNREDGATVEPIDGSNMKAIEAAIGDTNKLVGGAGFEAGSIRENGSLTTKVTWVFAVGENGEVMGAAETNTVDANPLINGEDIAPQTAIAIGASMDEISRSMGITQ